MKKRIVSFCLFLVFFVSFNAVAEIVTEPLTGVKLKWIINLHEPKESNIIVGTLEAVSSDAGNSICFRIRDVNGIEVYTSSLSGIFGGMEPLYDEEDNHIIGFRYFGSRSFSMALGTTEFWVVYMGVDLTPLYETLRWPVAPTKMYTPYSITSFDDGSYMTIGAENHKKICINHFNANDTMIGQEIKYLTVNSDSEEHFQLAGKLNVAKLSDNQIIIGANNNVDGIDKLSFFNINADGDHNISPLTSFGWNEWSDNRLGGVIIYQNEIIVIAESGGIMYGLILEPDFTEIGRFEYSDFSDIEGFQYPEDPILDPFCASVNPDGLVYIGGRARYGTNIEKLSLCTVDVNNLSNKKIMIEDVTAVVMAVTWTPTGAVGGGNITDGPSNAFWFEYIPDIPEPSNWYADKDGDTYGDPNDMVSAFLAPQGYVADNTDCNDNPDAGGAECYPGNLEICGDGLDNDCANGIDDGCGGGINEGYIFGPFLQPINTDGSSLFKAGRTIPVKITLSDDLGLVSTAILAISFNKISNEVIGNVEEIEVVSSSGDVDSVFRYDATDQHYIYNLSTKNLTAGVYNLCVTAENGQSTNVIFSLK